MGSLLALGLYTDRPQSRIPGCSSAPRRCFSESPRPQPSPAGTAFLDSALTLGFGGAVLAAIASTGARNPMNAILSHGPLAFYGRISYGLYMIHIMVFIYFGWFDLRMDPYGIVGNLAVVGFRLAMATVFAAALWYGFESQILKLKRFF